MQKELILMDTKERRACQSICYVKLMGWYHFVGDAVAKMTTIFMEWQNGDLLSYVASGPIQLKIFGFLTLTKYFQFLNNNSWLQSYYKFVKKSHNIKVGLMAHPAVNHQISFITL